MKTVTNGMANNAIAESEELSHHHPGHAHVEFIRKVAPPKAANSLRFESVPSTGSPCEGFFLKKAQVTLRTKASRSTKIEKLVHSGFPERTACTSPQGSSYYVTFIDECSSYIEGAAVEKKSGVATKLQKFFVWFERAYDCTGKKLHCDGGGECLVMKELLTKKGSELHDHPLYCSELIDLAEQTSCTLVKSARSRLYHAGMPSKF